MDDGDALRVLRGDEIGIDRLAHGYAVTVHRSQGATVERAHALEDGGGRELAYVKMSRATDRSAVYVVADSADQAAEDLRREWKVERRLTWVIDRSPATGHSAAARRWDVDAALRRGELLAERHAILAAIPADPTTAIRAADRELDRLRRRRADLETGRGSYANHPLNRAVIAHDEATRNVTRLQGNLTSGRLTRRERREKETQLVHWRALLLASARTVDDIRTPEAKRIDDAVAKITSRIASLVEQQDQRSAWFTIHPGAAHRLDQLGARVQVLDATIEAPARGTQMQQGPTRDRPWMREVPVPSRSLDIGIGL